MQYYISIELTFRRPKLQGHCEIQNQSKFVLLEHVIAVIDQALHAKATEIAWKHTSINAKVLGIFHTIGTDSPEMGNGSKMLSLFPCWHARHIIMPTRNHCRWVS